MLGLVFITCWMAFVAGYLIWQQVTGELTDGVASRQLSAVSSQPGAPVTVATELEDPRDARRSLVYRPTGFSASASTVRADR